MKKKLIILLVLVCANIFSLKSQDVESPEFKNEKRSEFYKPLGEVNGVIYYYDAKKIKDGITFTIVRYTLSTLEFLDEKEVIVNNTYPGNLDYHCQVEAYHKNGKFYFFYSLVHSGDFHVSFISMDENLTNVRETKLGVIVETGYALLGSFSVSLSPDEKSAIVSLKNKCEKKKVKAIGTVPDVIFENTELVYISLTSGAIIYKKSLPIELEESRVKTEQYKTDNEGNVTLIISIADRKGGNSIKAIGFGFLKKEQKNVTISEINTEDSPSISSCLIQAKNGDLIYTADLVNTILLKVLPLDKTKKIFETSVSKKNFKDNGAIYAPQLYRVSESENGYYLNFLSINYLTFSRSKSESIGFISKTGEFKWYKSIPVITPIHFNANGDMGGCNIYYNNKMYVFLTENKPYELTQKTEKMVAGHISNGEYNNKNTNAIMFTLNETGKLEKRVIHDNEIYGSSNGTFGANTAQVSLIDNKNILLVPINGKKVFKLKKFDLK